MKIIMIAHNQLELVKQGIKAIKNLCGIDQKDIIIVDNASVDGTDRWLMEQKQMNYLICDAGVEGYASILNTAIREFVLEEDVLVLRPNYIVLADALEKMHKVLYRYSNIGAVTATMIRCGESENSESYIKALNYVIEQGDSLHSDRQRIGLPEGMVLLRHEMLREVGEFDNQMFLPHSVILDYLLRGIRRGYKYFECGNAYFFEVGVDKDEYEMFGKAVDRNVLTEKWNMNYFNDIPNLKLVSEICEEPDCELDILEIGCDCGVNLIEVKNNFPHARLYGIELNEYAAEIASSLANVQVGNIEERNFDFKDVKFDYIMFGDVLEHLRDPAATVRYCRELLKEGGRIIACIPNLIHYSVMYSLINGNFTYMDSGLLDRTHIHFFTYNEIVKMFREEGFIMENVRQLFLADYAPEAESFVEKLVEISNENDPFMFRTFQYIVLAKKV